jgi:hypothetical protein
MRVLVACEESGIVRSAFKARGHEAFSCDLLPARAHSAFHFEGDVRELLIPGKWDLMIAHPPCDDIACSGARWFPEKIADGRQQRALDFVQALMDAPIPRICIENPVSVISTRIRKPDQIIQPWQFWHLDEPGTGEVKTTCLWLKGLPKLVPTTPSETGRHQACWLMGPSPTRKRDRSTTYRGIADAMAAQWGALEP